MSENILDGLSMNLEQANMDKLKSVFPECFAEGKLDIDKLLSLCGEYIDNDFEKYKFEWKGKAECLRLAQKRSTGTLRPCPEESVNWDTTKNLYIEGDNLEVLKLLQTAYYRKVKMIYIDPPYNTGNDFVYEDDFADPLAKYKEVTQQTTKSNPETMGRYHTNWLNMMYPRLRLAANLLRDDGVIFISIDDNEVDNLKKLCNEVFGEENFVAALIWEKKFAPQNDAKWFSQNHDYILCYARNKHVLNIRLLPRTAEMDKKYKNYDNDPRGVWTSDNLLRKDEQKSGIYTIITPNGTKYNPPSGRSWRVSKEKFLEMVKDNRIWFGADGGNVPRIKRFLHEVQDGIKAQTIWNFNDVGHNQEASQELRKLFTGESYFDTPKPVRLIERILYLVTEKSKTNNTDIILDFFSGSATTAHAVMQLNAEDGGNRQFIMVQLPEVCDEKSEAYKAGYKNICEIGKERIRRAGKKILEADNQMTLENKEQLDIGFKVFKLDSSNLKTWDNTPITAEQMDLLYERMNHMIHRVKSDRSDLDMVCEIMLKLGVPLTYSIIAIEINGKTAYSIGEDCMLLICLAPDVQPEDVEQMAEYAPAKLIISRESFVDDTAMANAHYILKDHGVELKLV